MQPKGFFATSSNQLQFPNDTLIFANANTFPIIIGDSYVLRFNFPLRVNDRINNCKCKNTAGVPIGDAYYHEKLRIIVCKVTSLPIGIQIAPLSASMTI